MGLFDSTVPSSIGYTPTSFSSSSTSSGSSGGGFFSSEIGSSLASSGISSLFNIGTSLVQSKQQKDLLSQQADIVAKQTEAQIAVAQLQLQQAQVMANTQSAGAGGNTMLYVGLGVGAVVILGVVIFAVTRSKS